MEYHKSMKMEPCFGPNMGCTGSPAYNIDMAMPQERSNKERM